MFRLGAKRFDEIFFILCRFVSKFEICLSVYWHVIFNKYIEYPMYDLESVIKRYDLDEEECKDTLQILIIFLEKHTL